MNYYKFITFERILILLITILSIGLLTWNRIDTGTHLSAINIETQDLIKRGEIMTTTDGYAIFKISNSAIFLSENTELKLVDGREGQIDLQLIQGRIILTENINVSIREIDIESNRLTSIVHYSWLDEIDIATIENETFVTFDNQTLILNNESINLKTLKPFTIKYFEFDSSQSAESEFYQWALKVKY